MFAIIYYPEQPENSLSAQRVIEEMDKAGLKGFTLISRDDTNFDFHSSTTDPVKDMTAEPPPVIQQHMDEYGETRMGPAPIIRENAERGHQVTGDEASSHDLVIDIIVRRKYDADLSEYQMGRIKRYRDWMLAEFDNSDINIEYILQGEQPVSGDNTPYWHYHELVDAMRRQADRHGFNLVPKGGKRNDDVDSLMQEAHRLGYDVFPQASARPISDISCGEDKETIAWDLTPNHTNRAYLDLLANRFGYDLIARVDTTPVPMHTQKNRDEILGIVRRLPSMIYGGRNSRDFVLRVLNNLDKARDAIFSTLKDPNERELFYEQYYQKDHGTVEDFEWPQGFLDALRRKFPDLDIREDAPGFVIPGHLEQTMNTAGRSECPNAGECDFQPISVENQITGKVAFCRPCGRTI